MITKMTYKEEINQEYKFITPLVQKMKDKYPKELNIEGFEPALTNDIAEISLVCREDTKYKILAWANTYSDGVNTQRTLEDLIIFIKNI